MTDLYIMRKRIALEDCPILYDRPLSLFSYVEDFNIRNASWTFEDGLVGKNAEAQPGAIFLRKEFPGNVLVDFVGQTLAPSTHDINVMWNMSWDEASNTCGAAYAAGVQGWWTGKVGLEKSPDYTLMAATPCTWFERGKPYHIQAGSINGHCFIFVDGKLQLELVDPNPINYHVHTHVGFAAFQSMVKISQVVIRQIAWEEDDQDFPIEIGA